MFYLVYCHYFALLQRLHDQRTDNDDLMKEKIETHKKEVQETKKLIKEKDEEIFHLKAEHEIILNQVQALSKQLNGKDDEIMKFVMLVKCEYGTTCFAQCI